MTKLDIGSGQYAALHDDIVDVVEAARRTAARNVNAVTTAAYWEIGRRVVNIEQGGQVRAEYGQALIAQLAEDLTRRFGRGFSRANLASMRSFYVAWPEETIFQTVSGKSEASVNFQTVSGKSQPVQTSGDVSSGNSDFSRLAARFALPWSAYLRLLAVWLPSDFGDAYDHWPVKGRSVSDWPGRIVRISRICANSPDLTVRCTRQVPRPPSVN